jgi:hypothetical protein
MVSALTPYRQMVFFPGGNPAAFAQIGLVLEGSNVPPQVFADAGATSALSLPLTADGNGTIAFYAAPGCYLAVLSGTRTRVGVEPSHPDPVFPDVYVHNQGAAALVWTIDHHMGIPPATTILLGIEQVEARIDHPDSDQTVITFSQPVAGVAQLRR